MKSKNLDRFKLFVTMILLFFLVFLVIQKPGMNIPADTKKDGIDVEKEISADNEGKVKSDHLPELPELVSYDISPEQR